MPPPKCLHKTQTHAHTDTGTERKRQEDCVSFGYVKHYLHLQRKDKTQDKTEDKTEDRTENGTEYFGQQQRVAAVTGETHLLAAVRSEVRN